jgi:hypothetical protein
VPTSRRCRRVGKHRPALRLRLAFYTITRPPWSPPTLKSSWASKDNIRDDVSMHNFVLCSPYIHVILPKSERLVKSVQARFGCRVLAEGSSPASECGSLNRDGLAAGLMEAGRYRRLPAEDSAFRIPGAEVYGSIVNPRGALRRKQGLAWQVHSQLRNILLPITEMPLGHPESLAAPSQGRNPKQKGVAHASEPLVAALLLSPDRA